MAYDRCPGSIEARVLRYRLENVVSCETDVLKGSWPAAAGIANPPVFYVARDYSFVSEGGAEMSNMRQVVDGLPETTVDNKEQRERSLTVGKSKLSELIGIGSIADLHIERR
jgi:hypothetical protein